MHRIIWHHSKRLGKHVSKKTAHILFPWIIHYLTDKYGTRHHHVVIDTIFSLTIIVLIAANIGLLYWLYIFLTPASLALSVDTPDYVISGSEITYSVDYKNGDKKIKNINFNLITPQGFSGKGKNHQIAYLAPGQGGKWEVTGELLGNVKEEQRVVLLASYDFHGQSYTQMAAHSYKINDTNFEVKTDLPETILSSEEFEFKVHYKNNAPVARKNITLALDLPATLEITQTPENYNSEKKEVNLAEVASWQEGDVLFKGRFSKAQGESDTFIGVSTNLDYQSKTYVQSTLKANINVLAPRLIISSSAPSAVNVGDTFYYSVKCQNIGDVDLTDIAIEETATSMAAAKTWYIPSLAPQTSQTVYLAIAIPANFRQENYSFSISSKATAKIGGLSLSTYAQSSTVNVKLNSTLNFTAEAKYYGPDGEQIGYGPYPLTAGDITSLRIFWNLNDFTNDLHNVTITTTLPSQVQYTGLTAVSQGANISYDPSLRKVIWHTGNIPAFSGPQGASFEVLVSPNSAQIGKQINIINDTYFTAEDSYTGVIISRHLGAVRTAENIW